ncbi:MAG TPA: sugar phosphate nucleotidyltransferase, partial [Planctomycetota bacterium]|nr:sugar phosphate nucleotidyltransferase [Planctomycetota bacterium]
ESEPLGTGGALRKALPLLSTDCILAMNGDSYVDADLGGLAASHRRRKAQLTILLTRVEDAARYGGVDVGPDGSVLGFVEKGRSGPGLINAGVYVLGREGVQEIPAGRSVSLEREVLPARIGRGFYAQWGSYPFLDIGTPESYRQAEAFFAKTESER